jgi:DNA-binding Lrp family transcriptional regulator
MTICCKNSLMDELDQRIAAALQVNGRASWLQVARVLGSSESTVARRAQLMMESGKIRVVVIADPVRCGFGYWVLLQIRCEVGESTRVAHTLAERPDVRYLALVTGPFDIVIELIVPSRRYLARILLEEIPKVGGIKETTTRMVLRNFKMAYDWSRDLLGPASKNLERYDEALEPEDMTCVLDEVDLRLYELLLEDGRRSFSELAAIAGISASMARRRVDSLWKKGCIRFATLIEPSLLGYDAECICWVRVDLSRLEQTAKALAAKREVRYLSATINYSDLIAEVVLPSQDALYEFCTEMLGRLPGVQEVNVNLKLQTVKQAYVRLVPPDEKGIPVGVGNSRTGNGESP